MPRPAAGHSDDVTINHLALHHAEVQAAARSLLDSFLGATEKDAEDVATLTLPEDTGGQIDEIEPEIHGENEGIGYLPPSNGDTAATKSRDTSAATERLRRQLLGKRATAQQKGTTRGTHSRYGQGLQASKPRPKVAAGKGLGGGDDDDDDDDDDDEDGRSRLGKKNKSVFAATPLGSRSSHQPKDQDKQRDAAPLPSGKKRGSSYLDQLLAERAVKKKKRSK